MSLAILRSETGETAVPMSAKRFVKPPAPAYIHLLTLEDPFTVRQSLILSHAKSAVNLKNTEFVCTCWIRHDLIACRRHPPFVANIEAESNVTTCRNEDEKKKRFRQNKLKFHCVFP